MCATCTRPPVSSASEMSRSAMIDSASPGMPRSPSAEAWKPSCATPSALSVCSSQCSITTMSNICVYSSARRISSAVATGRPSSVIATQPAARSSAISASCSPLWPRDTAPIGYTRARLAAAAFLRMYSVTPALSLTGTVFGMHATAVKPPATAAAVPLATVSLCSWPGSRRRTCMSINPGATITLAGISTTTAPSAGRPRPTRAIRSPSISRSNDPSRPDAGSTSRPPLSSRFIFDSARQQIEDRHPHRDAVGDLLEDHRVGAVGDLRGDLDTTVHRPGMHDDDVRPGEPDALLGHPEQVEVFAERREVRALHPLLLNPQHHHHVSIPHRLVDRRRHADAGLRDAARHERRRPAHPHFGPELGEEQGVRAQYAAVQEVADDRHLQPFEGLFVLPDGEGVKQRLGRVLVHPVAGVDDPRLANPGEQVARA